jgi:hypothetical protein
MQLKFGTFFIWNEEHMVDTQAPAPSGKHIRLTSLSNCAG